MHAKEPIDRGGLGGETGGLARVWRRKLAEAQGEDPLVQISVDSQTISEVISGWTGIPTGRMLADEIETVLKLKELLGERIIGQDHALEAIAQMIQTAHAGIEDPSKPTAVFLFVGPSGVGQDRDRPGPLRTPVRRRGERHHHQHVGVPGGPHGLRASRVLPRATWDTAKAAC